jgi:hypothetical protein
MCCFKGVVQEELQDKTAERARQLRWFAMGHQSMEGTRREPKDSLPLFAIDIFFTKSP